MWTQIAPALRITLVFTVLTGLIYPGLVTVLGQALFHRQANGSLIDVNGRTVGSSLLGQNFKRPEYFHPRLSAAGADGYDATSSGGTNLGSTSQKLIDRVKLDASKFRSENGTFSGEIPADALTSSASGLDPHISPANAAAQVARVAQARGISQDRLRQVVSEHTEGRDLGLLGEPRVNVLILNLALDQNFPRH